MELLIVLLVCGIIAIPVIAIVALVRTGKLRDSFEERFAEQMDRIRDLEGKLSTMRRDLAQVQQQGTAQNELTAAPQPVEAAKPEPAAAPQPAPPVTATVSHAVPPLVAAFKTPAPAQVVHALAKAEEREPVPPATAPTPVQQDPPTHPVAHVDPPRPPRPVPPPIAPSFTFAASQPPRTEEDRPPRKTIAELLRSTLPLEEVLGLNLFAKIGIVLLVLGFALLGRVALISMGPAARVVLIYMRSICGQRSTARRRYLAGTQGALPPSWPHRHRRRLGALVLHDVCALPRRAYGRPAIEHRRLRFDAHCSYRHGGTHAALQIAAGNRAGVSARFLNYRH